MSYLVLARKWRPRSFDTLVGQDHVVRALTHALSSGRLHHAWLFTGTRGVGKTTLSRILAKSLNCEQGVTATPCGHCQACTEIDAGRYVDYIELDAASNRGVDEMTQLLEQAVYAPSVGRYKVYMIDEVHMLTGHAFNAMLKTLEEPPEHVKFILATTDPQKIPVTVLSRCLQFNLKQMTVPAIIEHLQFILGQEDIPAEAQGLRLIAQAAAGSMRDALSLTDQAISYAAGNLTAAAVGEMLGTLDQHHLVALLQALAAADAPGVLAVADELALRGLSFQAALGDLAVLLSRVAIAQRLGHAQADDPLADDVQRLAGSLSPDDAQLFYAVAVHSRHELALAPDEYAGFVMACLRMLALLPPDRVPPVRLDPVPVRADAAAAAAPTTVPAAAASAVAAASVAAPAVPAPASVLAQAAPAAAPEALGAPAAEPPAWEAPVPPAAEPARAADQPPVAALPETSGHGIQSPKRGASSAASVPPASPEQGGRVDEPPVASVALAHEPPAAHEPLDAPRTRHAAPAVPEAPAHEPPEDAAAASEDWTADVPELPDDFEPSASADEFALDEAPLPGAVAGLRAAPQAVDAPPDPAGLTARDWPALAAALPVTGAARALAMNSEWLAGDEHQVRLRVAIHTLAEGGAADRLRTGLSEYFGRVLRLDVQYGDTGEDTAYAVDQADRAQRQQQAEAAAADDPLVQALVTRFAARIVPGSVRPAAV
ncbi:DNA polymerase III subunit gamma/tau [Castellaniella caeni]|uniref:DNA polymerase III subunit gamma/tau n=1 Tax=Castellaniella caeni TaxID=266123 RepID=UPI00082EAFEF|nr:DNA polymerase III subunit gamma/tau [Castellaniella caeni]